MPRDATVITPVNREAILNYTPGLGDFIASNFVGVYHLKLPIGFATANNATLATVPSGYRFHIQRCFWEVTTSFTGGTTPAIGVSSDDADYNTAGDILGGAAGDLTATLVSTGRVYKGGTIGAKFGSNGVVVVGSGKLIRFNRIADAFAAGAGFVHVIGSLVD